MRKIFALLAAACAVALVTVPAGAAEQTVMPDGIVLTPDPYADPLAIDPPMNAQCSAALPAGMYHDVTIPEHQTCTFSIGVHVTNDVRGKPDSTLDASAGGVIIDHDVVLRDARSLLFGNPVVLFLGSRVGHDFRVDGLTGTGQPVSDICNTFIGHDLGVQQLAAVVDLRIGSGCRPDEVAHDVALSNNAGNLRVVITGGGDPPPGYVRCADTAGPAFVGHDLGASGNTGQLVIHVTNICHDLTVTNNSGGNSVSDNHAGHDANCSNNNATVAGNTAEDQNNGC